MTSYDFRLFLIIFLFALTFCGKPDIHDAIISHVMNDKCEKGESK